MKLQILSDAQIRTLRTLWKSSDWCGSDEIVEGKGSVASLPKLLELGLIEERGHPAIEYRRQWHIVADDAQSINALFPHGLNRWARIHLWSGGIRTVDALRRTKDEKLLAIPHFGPKSLINARESFAGYVAYRKSKA
jgi:hypothetical protein